jgi:hypothetical protein
VICKMLPHEEVKDKQGKELRITGKSREFRIGVFRVGLSHCPCTKFLVHVL